MLAWVTENSCLRAFVSPDALLAHIRMCRRGGGITCMIVAMSLTTTWMDSCGESALAR